MKSLRKLLPVGLIALALVIGVSTAAVQTTQVPEWPTLKSTTPPDPKEVQAIERVVEQSYEVTGIAARTFEVSRFGEIFANDPAVSLSKEEVDYLMQNNGLALGSAQASGLLDYKLAFFGNWKNGAEGLERLEKQARLEGRPIRAEDLKAISKSGQHPTARRTDPMYKTNVKFTTVVVDGMRAEVVCDDGAVTYLLALLKTEHGWRIVGQRVLDIHV